MRKAFLDANVILRYVTGDPPEMAKEALQTFRAAERGEMILLLTPVVLAEVVWVLESFYEYPREKIGQTLIEFLHAEGIKAEDSELLTQALSLYEEGNLDFADALLASQALSEGPTRICSFDHDFDKISGLTRLKPGLTQ